MDEVELIQIESEVCAAKEWLRATMKMLVDREEDICLSSHIDQKAVTIFAGVHASDVGKVIGKSGRTARCLRILLAARGRKSGVFYFLDIVADANGAGDPKKHLVTA